MLPSLLLVLGWLLLIGGGIGVVVVAFRESVWWGLACLLVSPSVLFFVLMNWNIAKTPFLIQLCSVPCFIGAAVLAS